MLHISENPLHPKLLRLDIGAGVLTKKELDAACLRPPKRGFTCTLPAHNTKAIALLSSYGFTLARQTVEGGWRGDASLNKVGLCGGTLAAQPSFTAAWLEAHRVHYFATHHINPPAVLDSERWRETFLGADFLPEAAFFIQQNHKVVAFSSLRKQTAGHWELAWFGVDPILWQTPKAALLNEGLVAMETAYMATNGIENAVIELDSTNPDAVWRLNHCPIFERETYETYHLQG
ncbi:MAG: hypothetical protein COB08_014580 [Rhodobacteraceae bacterium]|nr:hypothetical protein [Paracoccaceae bacterium]